jgi:2-iminobutanoate/2-iminopropanoate deaminase
MKQAVQTDSAPKPIGPYSQAVKYGDLVFTSGQIPVDPGTGKMVEGDIQAQTEQVFRNLEAVLRAAGTSLQNAVKVTVFLADMADFAKVNEVYARQFEEPFPARSCVVSALPAGARLEIEVVASS